MYDLFLIVGLIAGWILLNVWLLPLFGVPTCMSGTCRVPRVESDAPLNTVDQPARVTRAEHE